MQLGLNANTVWVLLKKHRDTGLLEGVEGKWTSGWSKTTTPRLDRKLVEVNLADHHPKSPEQRATLERDYGCQYLQSL